MIEALNKKGYNSYAISVPSPKELLTLIGLAAPVLVTMMSKVTIYAIIFLSSLREFFQKEIREVDAFHHNLKKKKGFNKQTPSQ